MVSNRQRYFELCKKPTWEKWIEELKELATKDQVPEVGNVDPECWRDFYDDDMTPRDALDEEYSCWSE